MGPRTPPLMAAHFDGRRNAERRCPWPLKAPVIGGEIAQKTLILLVAAADAQARKIRSHPGAPGGFSARSPAAAGARPNRNRCRRTCPGRGAFLWAPVFEQNTCFVPFRRVGEPRAGRHLLFFGRARRPSPVPPLRRHQPPALPRPRRGRGTGGGRGGEAHGRKRQRKENRPGQRELRWNGRSPNPPAEPPARRSTAGIPPDPRGRRGEDPPWRQMPRGHSRQAGGQ